MVVLILFLVANLILLQSVWTEEVPDNVLDALLSGPFLPDDFSLGKSADFDPYTCDPDEESPPSREYNFRGTSLGGWLVLEPWITPSMFYQFLGAKSRYGQSRGFVAFDSKTFCEVLGSKEANRQLRVHWKHWVNEEQIRNLSSLGLNAIRIPIADWMFVPYYPFDNGCWDGAVEELDRAIALCEKYNMDVLLDLHAVRGSQNGLDNSGDMRHYEWVDGTSFRHWDIRGGDWAGQYDHLLRRYITINDSQLLDTLTAIQRIAIRYGNHSRVVGLQPVNEPWEMIPWPVLREFYWRTYRLLRHLAPNWVVVFHDSFRLGTTSDSVWLAANAGIQDFSKYKRKEKNKDATRFLANCQHYLVDVHIYHAWAWDPYDKEYFLRMTCAMGEQLRNMERAGVPLIVGEWSLATDNCAMWLNGLNDNIPGFPKAACERIPCPAPYFPADSTSGIPNTPPDKFQGRQDPYGIGGDSYVEYGTCPVDHTHNHCNMSTSSTSSPLSLRSQRSSHHHDDDEDDDDGIDHEILALIKHYRRNIVAAFAAAQWSAYNLHTHGSFFWNFRTELEDTWDIQRATAMHLQWLPRNLSVLSEESQRMIEWGCAGYDNLHPMWTPSKTHHNHVSSLYSAIWSLSDGKKPTWSSFLLVVCIAAILWGVIYFLWKRRIDIMMNSCSNFISLPSFWPWRSEYQPISSKEVLSEDLHIIYVPHRPPAATKITNTSGNSTKNTELAPLVGNLSSAKTPPSSI